MVSGEGDTSPSGTTRSSGLIPALAFIFVIIIALAVVFVLRQVLSGAAATETPKAVSTPGMAASERGNDTTTPALSAPGAPTAPAVASTLSPSVTLAPSSPSPRLVTTPSLTATVAVTRSPALTITAPATASLPTVVAASPALPPVALGVPPIIYSFYDWCNTDFSAKYPSAGPIGSLAVFGWSGLHTGPNQYDWSAIDKYLAQAAAMTVTLQNGAVISKPVILEITEYESVQPSKQIAHITGQDALSACFVYQDYTPDFVRQQISSTLTRPITYTMPDGSIGSLSNDGGSYLAEVGPVAGCTTETVGIVPKYDNATWQKYYREFVTALGARYDKNTQVVAVVFGPGIDQEYGQATKDFSGCALKAQVYKLMPETAYLDTVVKPLAKNDLTHAWRAAFPTKPLYLQFTSSGKERVDALAVVGINPPIGLMQATMVYDMNNQWQSNGRGTWQLMSTYSTTLPIAWENAYGDKDPRLGTGAAAMQNRYFTILASLSTFPDFMDFNGWVDALSVEAPWLLDFTRTYMGRAITTTDEIWVAMRDTEYSTPTRGSVIQTGWMDDATYGLRRTNPAPLVRRAELAAAPYNLPAAALDHPFALMTRRTDIAQGVKTLGFAADQRWPFWKQKPQTVDPSGVWYEVTVKYLDRGNDSFSLVYKDAAGATQRYLINKSNSNTWLTTTVTLKDAYLAGGLADGADLLLDAGTGDEVVHMVSIKGHATASEASSYPVPVTTDRTTWLKQEIAAPATATALARLSGVFATPTINKSLWLPLAEPKASSAPSEVQVTPPAVPQSRLCTTLFTSGATWTLASSIQTSLPSARSRFLRG